MAMYVYKKTTYDQIILPEDSIRKNNTEGRKIYHIRNTKGKIVHQMNHKNNLISTWLYFHQDELEKVSFIKPNTNGMNRYHNMKQEPTLLVLSAVSMSCN